jgi:hypothetical protein
VAEFLDAHGESAVVEMEVRAWGLDTDAGLPFLLLHQPRDSYSGDFSPGFVQLVSPPRL